MKKTLLLPSLSLFAITAFALPDYEPFADATGSGGTAYTLGAPLVPQTDAQAQSWYQAGASAPSATVGSLLYPGSLSVSGLLPSSGNSALLVPQANVASRFALGASISSGSIYYSFAFKVPDIGTTLGAGGGFVAGFNNTGAASQTGSPTVLGGRVLIRNVGGGTGFNIGLSKASSTATDFQFGGSPTTFTTSDTIFIVGSYDINVLATAGDDSARMWINPSSATFGAGSAPAATLTASTGADMITSGSIQSFLLYARANTLAPNAMIFDELRIGTSWADVTPPVPEPTSVMFGGLASLVGICWYRLRRRA